MRRLKRNSKPASLPTAASKPKHDDSSESSPERVKPIFIDATEEGGAFQIIGGVPPKSWLRKHGYIRDEK
jgi:hypothetical protein